MRSEYERRGVHWNQTFVQNILKYLVTVECCQGYVESVVPYFCNQTPRLLFISLLLLCDYYLRVVTIRRWRLFEGGVSLESLETSTMVG